MKVWVCQIPTYYAVTAVAATKAEAERVASERALQFLIDRDAVTDKTDTPRKVLSWFGVSAFRVELGSAVIE